MNRTPVLLYVLYPSHFKVMFAVARGLEQTGHYAPIIYFDRDAPYARDLAAARAANITCLRADGPVIETGTDPAPPDTSKRTLGARAELLALRAYKHVPRSWRQTVLDLASTTGFPLKLGLEVSDVMKARGRYRTLLEEHRIGLVIAPGDNVGYGTPLLFQAAHEAGIRALIVPFTVSNRLEMVADLRRHRMYSTARLHNKLLAAVYPHWELEHGRHRMVRVPAARAFVLQWAGVAPPDPWVLNSGAADAIAVESEFMADYYLRAGLPADKLRLTGTFGDDTVARALADAKARRGALAAELGLAADQKIVLFSYGEYHYFFETGRPSEFANQQELTAFWLDSMAAMPGFQTVLSLHPSLRREDVAHLEARGAKIATWPIEELIPLCDVYVASISATVRIAIACGKPVVDHDVFDFDYDNFIGLDAVWIAKTREQFAGTLHRLAADAAFYRAAVAAQAKLAPRFGRLDGHSGDRVLALVDELCERGTAPAARGAAVGS